MLITDAVVINQEEIIPGFFRMTMSAGEVAKNARPGQFLHVRCADALDPLLRRPVSIHAVDREKGEVALFYRVAGRGTALLAAREKGDRINILGPLGRGFTRPESSGKVSVAAGGIGIAPLYFLLQELSLINTYANVFLGAATKKQLFFSSEIEALGHSVFPATDDGTAGYHGTVVELFTQNLSDTVYGCGPAGMLKSLCRILEQYKIRGEVSLEERMGCGVGACLSCACKTVSAGENYRYSRVCVEGPVFPAGEVVWA
ncbi:MAG: dihydroorotate dehydrogenase electron transfer subunit [Desulfotomaculaceae bacterium]|nr:dihydroorotate dehydrogenase electron transfer subunit [Desulfotomaculaceae bacterium]MDD4766388.1 dihydroorotate dehydrogenase electron transfer subunit [Desulfotomaculaceae bacterium]